MLSSIEIQSLIDRMTLEEKIGMIHGDGLFQTKGVKRLNIPPLIMSDGPMGVRREFKQRDWETTDLSDDSVSYFLSNTALAATWNESLAYDFGKALGSESRSRGKDVILAPGINIIRTPLCGRNFEYMSEDPYLISKMCVPIIKGIQENDVAACVKHFVANNQETDRLQVNVEMDDRALEEIYLPGFEAAVKEGNAYTVMAAYNKLRGDYCCESTFLLKDILRDRWSFDGVVISDWGACHSTKKAADAGLDIEMSVTFDFDQYYFGDPLMKAVKNNQVALDVVNQKVFNILTIMNKLNMLDGTRIRGTRNTINHQQGILAAAEESIVLLKNHDNMLPINPKDYKSILVVGENAIMKHSTGGGSAEIKALYEHTPYAGISMYLGDSVKLSYVKGYASDKDMTDVKAFNLRQEAIRYAASHDLIIFIGGLNHDHDNEGKDRSAYTLPYGQDLLLNELYAVNDKIISINISGSAVDLRTMKHVSKALIQSWYNGMEGGRALAHVLFGQVNPSGKLPFTFAKKLEDYSAYAIGEPPNAGEVHYNESIFVGYRYFDSNHVEPMYPFGHGLSYTSFDYTDLKTVISERDIAITMKVKNTGHIVGKEVVQLYVRHKDSIVPKAYKALKAFKKIEIAPESTEIITFNLTLEDLTYYDENQKCWTYLSGDYTFMVASSSKDIRLKTTLTI